MTTPEKQPKKYFMRQSNDADLLQLKLFYQMNPHQSVLSRDAQVLEKMCKRGLVYLVESEAGDIVGASISYQLGQSTDGSSYKWMEIGTTRLTLTSFPGVFDALIGLQTLRTCLIDPPQDRVVCKVGSEPVQKIVQTFGFRPYQPQQELLDSAGAVRGQPTSSDNWLSLGVESMPIAARNIMRAATTPLVNPKTGETIQLDFSRSKFYNLFSKDIAELAQQNLGSPDAANTKISLAAASKKWARRNM